MSQDKKTLNHILHSVLSILTFGLWLPVYFLLYLVFKSKGSTLESRREKRRENRELTKRVLKDMRESPRTNSNPGLGYKKGKGALTSTEYQLQCGHLIRAKTAHTSLNYLKGKEVFCEICKETRQVIGIPRMV